MGADNTSTPFPLPEVMEHIPSDNTSTPFPSPEVIEHIRIFSLVLYCVITVVGTVGNGLVIYVTGFKMKKTVNSVWFLNLAIADFLFTTFLIFTTISLHHRQWYFGIIMCKLVPFVSVVNMFASIFLLTAISLDRCLSVWVVVWAQNKRTVCKAQISCAVIWLAAGICSFPFAYLRSVIEVGGKEQCGFSSMMTAEHFSSLIIFRFAMGFLLPFLVILSSYVAIIIRTMRLQTTRKGRSHRIIISIILAFFICWLPFHVVNFIELKSIDNPDLEGIVLFWGRLSVSLAFLNSCLNPILYVFMCEEFLKKLRQSILLVLESVLVEDHGSDATSHTLDLHSSKTPRS